MATATKMTLVFADTGLDGLWAIYVLLAVLGSALLFLKAFNSGNYFFQDEDLKV